MRPSGTVLATPARTGSGYFWIASVSKCPVAIAVSLMPKRDHSIDSTRIMFSTAARAADECAMPGRPWCGDSVTLITFPPPPGIIDLVATAWVISQVPSRLSRTTARKPLALMSSAGDMYWPPALFTSVLIRPCRSRTLSTNARTWSSSRMSQTTGSQLPGSHSAAVSSSGSSRRPATTTRAPSEASSTAVARPIPEPPPVTTITWPSSSPGRKTSDGIGGRLPAAPSGRFAGAMEATTATRGASFVERRFRIQERGSTARVELLGGLGTFLTMCYILFVNLVGLRGGGIVINDPATGIALGALTAGPPLIALGGVLTAAILSARNIRGSILIGVLTSAALGLIFGVLNGPSGVAEGPGAGSV